MVLEFFKHNNKKKEVNTFKKYQNQCLNLPKKGKAGYCLRWLIGKIHNHIILLLLNYCFNLPNTEFC